MIHRGIDVWNMPLPYLLIYAEHEEDVMDEEKGRLQWALAEVFGDPQEVKKMKEKHKRQTRGGHT